MLLEPQRNLDLANLHTFLTVVEQGSLSAAASILRKTPSAVSYRIKNLEQQLGVQLILRTTHSIEPTGAGLRLVDRAKDILAWQDDVYEELQLTEAGVEPVFTIAVNNLLHTSSAVARLLKHLGSKFPRTAFEIKRSVYMGVWDDLIHNKAHFAIGTPNFHPIGEDHRTEALGLIEWQLVCSPGHPSVAQDGRILKADVQDIPVINIRDTSVVIAKRSAWRLRGQNEIIVADMDTKIQCHIAGLGVGFLPKPIAQRYIDEGSLIRARVEGLSREDSPMSYASPKQRGGVIADPLEELLQSRDEIILPLLNGISTGAPRHDS